MANSVLLLLLALSLSAREIYCFAAEIDFYPPQNQPSTAAAVKAAYEAYLRAWRDKDYNSLNDLLSDDYQAVNFQGVISTKANEIATAKEDRTYDTMSGNVISVAVFGDSSVASGLIEASWKDAQGNLQKSTFRFLAMLQRQKGDWKLVATQSTKFNRAAEPSGK